MSETAFGYPGDSDMGADERGGVTAPGEPGGDGLVAGAVLGAITLPGCAREVARIRRFVAKTLGDHPQVDTAVLLTSEAVANSVTHTRSATVTVVVMEIPAGLRFEVIDDGGETVPAVYRGCDLREDKRGLFLVQELSVRCGFHTDESGLTYWFEL
jgi:hypothetical protein